MKKIGLIFLAFFLLLFPVLSQERFVSQEPSQRKVLAEVLTGVTCPYCAGEVDSIVQSIDSRIQGDFYAMFVHAGTYAHDSYFDLSTEYGQEIDWHYGYYDGGWYYPTALLNRRPIGKSYRISRTDWAAVSDSIRRIPAYLNVASRATVDWTTRRLEVKVQVYYTGDSPDTVNFLNVALLQDNVFGFQNRFKNGTDYGFVSDGVYRHRYVLRDLLTGQWGDTIKTTRKGSFLERTYTVTLPDSIRTVPLNLHDISILAFVAQGKDDVINVCEAEMTHLHQPEYLLTLLSAQMKHTYSCDNRVAATILLNTHILKENIRSLSYECIVEDERYESTCVFDTAVSKSGLSVFDIEPIPVPLNKTVPVLVRVKKINGEDYLSDMECCASFAASKYMAVSEEEDLMLLVNQDRYGTDITWMVRDGNFDTIYADGPYSDLDSAGTVSHLYPIKIGNGCYSWTVYDKSKNGINNSISSNGAGNLRIMNTMNDTIWKHDGCYEDSILVMLVLEEFLGNEITGKFLPSTLYPNPASLYSRMTFALPMQESLSVEVLDMKGHCVLRLGKHEYSVGKNEIEIPVGSLRDGLYIVWIKGMHTQMIGKLVVRH